MHRIVATAFHGDPPDPKYVVDHIDSNCRNNRPENLRWLTRLENTLKNPVTRKKIEFLCGSVEAFLANPSILNSMNISPNMSWMKAVTHEEAENCKLRMAIWANSKNIPTGSYTNRRGAFDKRVFKPLHKWEAGLAGEPGLDFAETPMCGQYMWHGSFFPMCPNEFGISALDSYFQNIKIGELFSYGDSSPRLIVNMVAKTKNHPAILVLCDSSGSKPFALCAITLNEKGYFVHFVVGTYSDKETAKIALENELSLLKFSSDGYNGFRGK
ncbi:MAG: HNH endonuclease [Bdellovibrionaceae bacterium]|nr:HNH endonuclease [Pseudobdellovibrionaceae bacterium]